MRGMPFHLQGGGGLEEEANFWSKRRKGGLEGGGEGLATPEPTSVLDKRSPSSPTSSTSNISSSLESHHLGPTDVVPTPTAAAAAKCLEDWDSILSDTTGEAGVNQGHTFLHWTMGDDVSGHAEADFGFIEPGFGLKPPIPPPTMFPPPPPPILPNSAAFFEQSVGPNLILNQNPSFLPNLPQFEHHQPANFLPFHPNSTFPASAANAAAPIKPKLSHSSSASPALVHNELVESLFCAAEFVESGNPVSARGILARLNHQLPAPIGKPLLRSAFYFKEALHLLATNTPPTPTLATPLDVLLKLGTYKAFSEISPILQFTNFTSIQAILEELDGCDRIHIIDFDIGVGGHWSSFIQELAHRRRGTSQSQSLRITAFASHSSHHPLELHLTRENLSHFAADLNVQFEFNVLSLDSFDAMSLASDEAIAVNFPIGSGVNYQSVPAVLRLIKQLNPRIVVSVDHGCNRSDLQFSHHFLHAFQECMVLLDSLDASGANPDVVNKIERYLVQPRIENVVLGRAQAVEKMMPWKTMFASAGFKQVQFSNFTETQAECLLRRVQVRGFHVEKQQASLFLCWQQGELVSVSAWKC